MINRQIIDMNYWDLKELNLRREYPLLYEEKTKTFIVVSYERHRAYRTQVIKPGYEDNFEDYLTKEQKSDIYDDFTSPGGLKSQGKMVEDIDSAVALGINESTFKYIAEADSERKFKRDTPKDIQFTGKCKSLWCTSDRNFRLSIDGGDDVFIAESDHFEMDFAFKLINPVFTFTAVDDACIHYYIDGEVL